jgi:hypothetical protein
VSIQHQIVRLLKVCHGYIAPFISIKINQYSVENNNCIEKSCHVVMWLNLQSKHKATWSPGRPDALNMGQKYQEKEKLKEKK